MSLCLLSSETMSLDIFLKFLHFPKFKGMLSIPSKTHTCTCTILWDWHMHHARVRIGPYLSIHILVLSSETPCRRLAGKACEDSDYTPSWSPSPRWCSSEPLLVDYFIACRFFIAWRCARWATTLIMRPNAMLCVNEHEAKLFSVWKLQMQPVTDLCKSPVSYWWPTLGYSKLQLLLFSRN